MQTALVGFPVLCWLQSIAITPFQNVHKTQCQAQVCSKRLQRGLMRLFPDRQAPERGLAVITVNQHTEHSMASWSHDVEEEREVVLGRVGLSRWLFVCT